MGKFSKVCQWVEFAVIFRMFFIANGRGLNVCRAVSHINIQGQTTWTIQPDNDNCDAIIPGGHNALRPHGETVSLELLCGKNQTNQSNVKDITPMLLTDSSPMVTSPLFTLTVGDSYSDQPVKSTVTKDALSETGKDIETTIRHSSSENIGIMTSSDVYPMVTSQLTEPLPTADTVYQPYTTTDTAEYITFSTEIPSETSTNNGNSVGYSKSNSVSSFHSRADFLSTTVHVTKPTQAYTESGKELSSSESSSVPVTERHLDDTTQSTFSLAKDPVSPLRRTTWSQRTSNKMSSQTPTSNDMTTGNQFLTSSAISTSPVIFGEAYTESGKELSSSQSSSLPVTERYLEDTTKTTFSAAQEPMSPLHRTFWSQTSTHSTWPHTLMTSFLFQRTLNKMSSEAPTSNDMTTGNQFLTSSAISTSPVTFGDAYTESGKELSSSQSSSVPVSQTYLDDTTQSTFSAAQDPVSTLHRTTWSQTSTHSTWPHTSMTSFLFQRTSNKMSSEAPSSSDMTTGNQFLTSSAISTSPVTFGDACQTWSSYNGHEYCVSDFLKSWEEADQICRSFSTSSHLMYIESSEEQTFIESIIVTGISTPFVEFWHGINDRETEGSWRWGDELATYIRIQKGDTADELATGTIPDNLEDCATMDLISGSIWTTRDCLLRYNFICEKDPDPFHYSISDASTRESSTISIDDTTIINDMVQTTNEASDVPWIAFLEFNISPIIEQDNRISVFALDTNNYCLQLSERIGSSYCFSNAALSWEAAASACQSFSPASHLVLIDNLEEQEFLSTTVLLDSRFNHPHWIGLNDLDVKGAWIWVNDAVGKRTFFNWSEFQPSEDSLKNCAILRAVDGLWYNFECSVKYNFICEHNI